MRAETQIGGPTHLGLTLDRRRGPDRPPQLDPTTTQGCSTVLAAIRDLERRRRGRRRTWVRSTRVGESVCEPRARAEFGVVRKGPGPRVWRRTLASTPNAQSGPAGPVGLAACCEVPTRAREDSQDASRGFGGRHVLVDTHDPPARSPQQGIGMSVPRSIGFQFGSPPCGVGLRPGGVPRACVPEATVYEDRDLRSCEQQVGAAPHPGQRRVHSVAASCCRQGLAQQDLGTGVCSSLRSHACAGCGGRRPRSGHELAVTRRRIGGCGHGRVVATGSRLDLRVALGMMPAGCSWSGR